MVDTSAGTTSAVVNLTPITELIMAHAVGATSTPSAVFVSNMTPPTTAVTNLPSSIVSVANSLKTATNSSVDFSGSDPVTKPFRAATSSTAGDEMDGKIDALMNTLRAANQSVSDISNTLVASSASSTDTLTNALARLPSLCPYAHSGNYQFVSQSGGYTTIAIDLEAKKVTVADNSWGGTGGATETNAFIWINQAKCQGVTLMTPTSSSSSGKQFVFSKGGVIVAVTGSSASASASAPFLASPISTSNTPSTSFSSDFSLGFPVQRIPLTSMPNTFSTVEYDTPAPTGARYPATFWGVYKLDANGNLTCLENTNPDICAARSGIVTANADGTFNLKITNAKTSTSWHNKLFVYRAPDGQILFTGSIANSGGMVIGSVQNPLVAPTAATKVNTWEVKLTTSNTTNASDTTVETYSQTQTPLDSASYTRRYLTKNGAAYDWVDTFIVNSPTTGFRKRPALTYNGVVAFDYFVLPLPGNMAAFIDGRGTSTSDTYFGFGVTTP